MNIAHAMSCVIQRARSLTEVLNSAVQLVAREMGTDVCSIYLLDSKDHRLRLMATEGFDKAALGKVTMALGEGITGCVVKEMRSMAVEDASSHPGYRYFPETKEEQFQSYLGVPLVMRNRPVGAIVVRTKDRRIYSAEETQTLSTIAAQLVGVVENARLIDALDRGEEGTLYLDEVRSWRSLGRGAPKADHSDLILEGSPASPGIAIGRALFRGSYDFTLNTFNLHYQGEVEELRRITEAFDLTRRDVLKIQKEAEREAGEEHALIFSSHLLLLNDPILMERILAAVKQGLTAPMAIHNALEYFSNKLQSVPDPYIQDRMEDIQDLRGRILGHLLAPDQESPTMSDKVVVTRGIPPSLVVELKAEGARGIITERGGPTSHGALLARSMGIPAVTGIADMVPSVRSGALLILDGYTGKVIVSPSPSTLEVYEQNLEKIRSRRISNLKYRDLPAKAKDGLTVRLQANVGVGADIHLAKENGAQGIGLFRTEFPFIIREHFPTQEEQIRIYRKAYEYFPEGPINFRLLDLGGDKFLPRNALAPGRNPFSGYRSIRVLLNNPEVLRDQVQAFARAAGSRPLSILIPMVSSLFELKSTIERIREALEVLPAGEAQRAPTIGAMIEVPAAVEIAGNLARYADYFSIGSNDLMQYTLAVDRDRAECSNDSYHPAILRLIRRTIAAGHAAGKTVSLCGEMASRPRLALALVAMGIDSLSMNPGVIPEIKRALALVDLKGLAADMDRVLELEDAAEIKDAVRTYIPDTD